MMTNEEIYLIAEKLGLIDETSPNKEMFDRDIISVTNFINDLFIYNDTFSVKQFIIAVIMTNKERRT